MPIEENNVDPGTKRDDPLIPLFWFTSRLY